MARCMPEVLGDGGGDQGAGSPRPKQFNGTGEPAKPSVGAVGGGLSWFNAGLQRLVVDPECSGVRQGEARLPLQARVGAEQALPATHQQWLELVGQLG